MDSPDQDPNFSLRRRFTLGFLKALARIHRCELQGPSLRETSKRRRRVRSAADVAMASAVGPTRIWSRAVLKRRRFAYQRSIRTRRGHMLKITGKGRNEKKLRKVVPGGEDMDVQSLLEETFHYISCLKTQVNVMRSIAEIIRPNT